MQTYFLNPKTPIIDASEWPGTGGLNLFIFSDRQLCILQSLLFPYVRWRTRFASPLGGNLYQSVSDEVWAELLPEADDLEVQLWSGKMDISDLVGALTALANAISAEKGVNVSCGVGEPLTAMQGCLDQYNPADFIPAGGETQPDVEGPPPEGFDSWEAYFDYKCKAAHSVFQLLRKTAVMLTTFDNPIAHVAVVTAGIGALALFLPAAFTPPGIAAMAAAIIAFNVISYAAAEHCDQIVSYLDAHKDAIICDLYISGDAAAALEVIADWLEDAIQAIEWGEILGPLAPELNAAIGAVFSQVENNGTVNVLFRLTEDILLPDVTCSCFEGYAWHFTAGVEGWTWYISENPGDASWEHSWTDVVEGADPGDQDAGRLTDHIWGGDGSSAAVYHYVFPLPLPIAATGIEFSMHYYLDSVQAAGFNAYIIYDDDTYDNVYYLGNTGWNTVSVTVTAPNNGKAIKEIGVQHHRGSGASEMHYAWDHAIFQ